MARVFCYLMFMIKTRAKIKEARLTAVVIRADGRVEDLGTIAYHHSNPLRQLIWRISCFIKRRKA
jgi:hypothetical protein